MYCSAARFLFLEFAPELPDCTFLVLQTFFERQMRLSFFRFISGYRFCHFQKIRLANRQIGCVNCF